MAHTYERHIQYACAVIIIYRHIYVALCVYYMCRYNNRDKYIIIIGIMIIISMRIMMCIIIVAYINIVPIYVYAVHFHIPSTAIYIPTTIAHNPTYIYAHTHIHICT